MAQTRKTLEWVLESVWPWLDSNELFHTKWEETFGTWSVGSGIPKFAWLTALMRLRTDMTLNNLKPILGAVWGSMTVFIQGQSIPGAVYMNAITPYMHQIPTYVASGYVGTAADIANFCAKHQNIIHFYATSGAGKADHELFARISNLIKPTWQTWTCARGSFLGSRYGTKVASCVMATKTITATTDVCDPTVPTGFSANDVGEIAGEPVMIASVNVGGDPKVFTVSTWPWASDITGKEIGISIYTGGYSVGTYAT
jgi:hypothetical protein